MELPGREIDRDIDHREAQRPVAEVVHDPLLDRRDVVLGYGAADHGVGEDEAAAARQRLHLDLDVGELAVAAALALEARVLLAAAA